MGPWTSHVLTVKPFHAATEGLNLSTNCGHVHFHVGKYCFSQWLLIGDWPTYYYPAILVRDTVLLPLWFRPPGVVWLCCTSSLVCSFSNHFFVHSICLSVCGFDQASIPKLLILLMLFSVTSWYSSATALQKVLRDLQTVFFGDFTLHPDYMNGTR